MKCGKVLSSTKIQMAVSPLATRSGLWHKGLRSKQMLTSARHLLLLPSSFILASPLHLLHNTSLTFIKHLSTGRTFTAAWRKTYMRISEGTKDDPCAGKSVKVYRALYGLKQAGRVWSHHIHATLTAQS